MTQMMLHTLAEGWERLVIFLVILALSIIPGILEKFKNKDQKEAPDGEEAEPSEAQRRLREIAEHRRRQLEQMARTRGGAGGGAGSGENAPGTSSAGESAGGSGEDSWQDRQERRRAALERERQRQAQLAEQRRRQIEELRRRKAQAQTAQQQAADQQRAAEAARRKAQREADALAEHMQRHRTILSSSDTEREVEEFNQNMRQMARDAEQVGARRAASSVHGHISDSEVTSHWHLPGEQTVEGGARRPSVNLSRLSRDELRRAIVLKEILSPPISLRNPDHDNIAS